MAFHPPPLELNLLSTSVVHSEESSPNESLCSVNDQSVIVSHINTPHQFFVQNPKVIDTIDAHCLSESKKAPHPDPVNVDHLYLAEKNSKWFRVKVTKANNIDWLEVLFVDYGQTETFLNSG